MKKIPNITRVIIDIALHFIITMVVVYYVYSMSRNIAYAIAIFCGGILLDLDHFIDYYIYFRNKFRIGDFLGASYLKSRKVYLLMHSWELVFMILCFSFWFNSRILFFFCLAAILHLAMDNLQRKNLFFYFISYRIFKKFDAAAILTEYKGTYY